eukprot:gene26101-26276_t
MAIRSVVLDTETTGMPVTDGHRIIEIGCVELMGRRLTGRHFHVYLQPDRESDEGAIGVHGITNEFLVGKPRFAEVADEFFEFINGAQLIIHNAAFDVGFINNEFALMGQTDRADITRHCSILDTLMMARLSPEALAGGGLGAASYSFVSIFCIGVIAAVGTLVAIRQGAGDIEGATRLTQAGLWLAWLMALAAALLLWNLKP